MSTGNALYGWLTDWMQQDRPAGPVRLCDFERIRQELLPGDVLLVDGHSRVDETFKGISSSRWSRAALYLGRLHDIGDPALRATLSDYLPCSPDTQLIVHARLDRGLVLEPLSALEPDHLRICRPRGLGERESRELVRYAVSRLGLGTEPAWWTLVALMMPWGWLPRRWRAPLFGRLAGGLLRLLSGTTIGEAFSFVQFPVLPLVKREEDAQTRLYRRHPRVFFAVDFDHSPYFDVIKYPFIDQLSDERVRLHPWQGQSAALTGSEQQQPHGSASILPLHGPQSRKKE